MSETNQVKWVGIRPIQPLENIQTHLGPFEISVAGVTRTQITKSVLPSAGYTIVHTVTAGKTLYLVSSAVGLIAGASNICSLHVRNGADAIQYYLARYLCTAESPIAVTATYPVPISIQATFDIVYYAGTVDGFCHILGWEQ